MFRLALMYSRISITVIRSSRPWLPSGAAQMRPYGEAIAAYDRFEQAVLRRTYGDGLLPAVRMFDLLWELESLARKFGVEDKAVFARLRKRICTFSSERTALANGVNGKRFYLMQDSQALSRSRPANPRVSNWLHYSGLLSSVIDPGITRLL